MDDVLTKTSSTPLLSVPEMRLVAPDSNAAIVPSGEMAGKVLAPLPAPPPE